MDIIVVEGVHDEAKIKSVFPNACCVITNGREIHKETIEYIQKLSKHNRIIVFTDPDSPGEKIRNIITEAVPEAKQAFLRKRDCISKNKKKVGIEHASKEAIIEALGYMYGNETASKNIGITDLYELGLNGGAESAVLRNKISDLLNIGRPNAKTFLKRVNMLGLTKKEIEEILCRIK